MAAFTECPLKVRVGENSDYPTICERCVAALCEIDSQIDAPIDRQISGATP